MELRDYVKIIGRHFWLLLVVILFITLGTFYYTLKMPESFDGSVSINVNKAEDKLTSQEYQYDKYYAFQASSYLADTILNWLQDPSNVIKIYDAANLNLPTDKLNKLTKMIKAKKKPPATINITTSALDEITVKNLLNSTTDFIDKKMQSEIVSDLGGNFKLSYSSPAILKHQKSLLVNSFIGFIVGLVLGLALVFVVEYFSPKNYKS